MLPYEIVLVLLVGMIGGSLASFLCVVAERTSRGESIGGRSHCACGRQLAAKENIPILGWLLIRGTARCCGAKLPAHYLAWEIAFFLGYGVIGAWLLNVALYGDGVGLVELCLSGFVVIVLGVSLLAKESRVRAS